MSWQRWASWALPGTIRRVVAEVDIGRAGLLQGWEGPERRRRAALLTALHTDGVSVAEMRAAVDQGRLGPMAVHRALLPDAGRYTLEEIAAVTGVEGDQVARWFRALERPVTDGAAERIYTGADLDIARRLQDYRRLGLRDDDILPAARAVGRAVATASEAMGTLIATHLFTTAEPDPGDALGYAVEMRRIVERDGLHLAHLVALGLSERMNSHLVALGERGGDELPGSRPVAVGFADIVGFTDLGEHVDATELADLADDLAAVTSELLAPPVRLTKTIGDAVMLVSAEPEALVRTAVEIARRWHGAEPRRPALRVGLAWGRAISQAGDWFGAPVNLASRITASARPGTVLADARLREACEGDAGVGWRRTRSRRFKGVPDRHELYEVGPAGA